VDVRWNRYDTNTRRQRWEELSPRLHPARELCVDVEPSVTVRSLFPAAALDEYGAAPRTLQCPLVYDGEERCGDCLRSLFVRLPPRGRLGNTGIPPAVDRSEDCTQYVYQRVHHVFAGGKQGRRHQSYRTDSLFEKSQWTFGKRSTASSIIERLLLLGGYETLIRQDLHLLNVKR
jgi:hypothetical protein